MIFTVFAVAAILVIIVSLTMSIPPPAENAQGPAPTTTQQACPANVAQYLPNAGADVLLVVQYQDDDNHIVTICENTATSQYYYDGQVKGEPANNDTHISLPATQTGAGFVANNGEYQYEINDSGLIISQNGTVLRESKLTQIAP